jgi:hypothetical protein
MAEDSEPVERSSYAQLEMVDDSEPVDRSAYSVLSLDSAHRKLKHHVSRLSESAGHVFSSSPRRVQIRHWNLQKSTYDAAVLALCFVEDTSITNTSEVYFQLGFAWFLHFAVVSIEFMLVYLIFGTVVEEAENPFERDLTKHIHQVRHATHTGVTLDRHGDIMQLCRKDHTLASAHTMVVLIWSARMLREMRSAIEMIQVILNVPTGPESIDEKIDIDEETGDLIKEEYNIVRLTLCLKSLLIIFIGMSRALVTAFLAFTSAKYLILEGNMANVILKAVSMQFIVTLDTLFFSAFIPTTFVKKVQASVIKYMGERPSLSKQWMASVGYVVVTVGLVLFLIRYVFGDIYHFRVACREYFMRFPDEREMSMDMWQSLGSATMEGLGFASHQSAATTTTPHGES